MFLRYTSSLAPTFTLALHTVRWSSTFSLPETPLYVTFENCTVIEKFGREEHVDLPDFTFTGAVCYRLRRKIENKTIPTDCSFVCLFIKAINSQQFIVNSKHEEVSRPLNMKRLVVHFFDFVLASYHILAAAKVVLLILN